jgi:general secretion pathway protein K
MDWRDKDNERPGLNVVNNEDLSYKLANYPYTPKNDSFQTKEELLLIIGMTPEIYRKIEPYITLFGSGKIGINTASEVVLRATGLDASVVDKIMRFRTFDLASGRKCSGSLRIPRYSV